MSVNTIPFADSESLFTVTLDSSFSISTTVTASSSAAAAWISDVLAFHSSRLDSLIVGLDCEWRPNFSANQKNPVAILQLCVDRHCLVFQLLHSDSVPPQLIAFLSDPRFKFVGVGIDEDIKKLLEDYEISVKNTVDLRSLAAEWMGAREAKKMGLKKLAEAVMGVEVKKPKRVTMSKWDQPVLMLDQIGYACVDAFLSFEIGRRLFAREFPKSTTFSGDNAGRMGGGGNIRTKKIFVGGLPPTLTDTEFRQYFQNYGEVTDVVVMYDQNTQRPRGFGFISFENEDAVDRVLHKTFHELNGKMVEVKRALPKDANPNSGTGGRSGSGGSYQSYGGGSAANSSSYDGRMDANRYMQLQTAGGGYPSYGLSGYGALTYGYGAANNGVGYGGYVVGGYGGWSGSGGGFSGPYGKPNAPAGGYVSGPPGAPRSPWNNQAPTGYVSSGYGGSTGYVSAPNWNAQPGSGGSAAAPTGQSPNAATGYGNQGYGYGGGYGGADGSYGNQRGYGSVGGRGGAPNSILAAGGAEQGMGYGYYMGSGRGYGDANGNFGYSNAWRSGPSQGGYGASQASGPPGGLASYGGGYGGAQSRQAQQ